MKKFKNRIMFWILERSLEYFSPSITRDKMIDGKIISDPISDDTLYWNYRTNGTVFKCEFSGMDIFLINEACLRVRALLEIQRRRRYDK